jgi:AcrR family transcriptional regulator
METGKDAGKAFRKGPGGRRPTQTRARDAEAKESRRAALLGSAERLFAERDFSEVSIAGISAGAGLAKGTAYLYFNSKESLFLALLSERLREWVEALQAELGNAAAATPEQLAQLLARSLLSRGALVRLLSILHAVLEQNVEPGEALAFKRGLAQVLSAMGTGLARVCRLSAEEGARVVLWSHAVVVGLSQMAQPAPAVAAALEEDPALAPFRISLAAELEAALATLFRGAARRH